jgi:hypothetical protein
MNTYQFVTAVHGNESLPTLALASVGLPQVIANPRALAQRVRYTEKDLNASFGTDGTTYEEERAREVTKILDPNKLVIDFHTFSCESESFAIVVDMALLPIAQKLGVKHIAYMKHNIKAGHALINYCPGVSVEVGSHTDPTSFDATLEIIKNLDKSITPKARVYEVFGRIEEKGSYTNFRDTGEFVPILYGERAYDNQNFYGLKAREITGTINKMEEI